MESIRWSHLDIPALTKVAHWHPQSQRFAGADHLLCALHHGWQPDPEVMVDYYHYSASASAVPVYRFRLHRGDEIMEMPVISTPWLSHVIVAYGLGVLQAADSDTERLCYCVLNHAKTQKTPG